MASRSMIDAYKAAIDAEIIVCENKIHAALNFGSEEEPVPIIPGACNRFELDYVNTILYLHYLDNSDIDLIEMDERIAKELNDIGEHLTPRRRFELTDIVPLLLERHYSSWWMERE